MKVNKTAVIVFMILGLIALFVSAPLIDGRDEREALGFGIFLFFFILLHVNPELIDKMEKNKTNSSTYTF